MLVAKAREITYSALKALRVVCASNLAAANNRTRWPLKTLFG